MNIIPVCRYCAKPLRRYHYRLGGPTGATWAKPGQEWGDYGDNYFCGKTCGHAWAVNQMQRLEAAADAARRKS